MIEEIDHYSHCPHFIENMCKDRENTYRICMLPKCCGICDKLKICFCGCINIDN